MKVVILPGVGFQDSVATYETFANNIKNQMNCETEIFYWTHDYQPLVKYFFEDELRIYTAEIIMDFQQAIRHATEMTLPPADYYIGHSAGGLMSLVQNKNCIVMGCPALLAEMLNDNTLIAMQRKMVDVSKQVLNIVNEKDVLSYVWNKLNVENWQYSSGQGWAFWKDNPYSAHTNYWTSYRVMKKIISKLKFWENIV